MTRRTQSSSLGRFLIGGAVAALVFACAADAVQSTTTPNAAYVTYSLAANATTGNYAPSTGTSTLIMGANTKPGWRGVGQVSILRIPVSDPSGGFIEWCGKNSATVTANNGTNSSNYSSVAGTRIIALDYGDAILLEVGTTKDTVRVHNTSTTAQTGNLTWAW